MPVHLVEMFALLFVEFIVNHSGGCGDEQDADDEIKSMDTIRMGNLPIHIGPQPHQGQQQKNKGKCKSLFI